MNTARYKLHEDHNDMATSFRSLLAAFPLGHDLVNVFYNTAWEIRAPLVLFLHATWRGLLFPSNIYSRFWTPALQPLVA